MVGEDTAYLLPSRVPHSPQRRANTLGLVVERNRKFPLEMDRMSWYKDFATCDQVVWERYFYCDDLGKDLVPVVREYEAARAEAAQRNVQLVPPPLAQGVRPHEPCPIAVPDPVAVPAVASRAIASRSDVAMFGPNHPDREFDVVVESSPASVWTAREEIFVFQIAGDSQYALHNTLHSDLSVTRGHLREGECIVVALCPAGKLVMERPQHDAATLVVSLRDWQGNKVWNAAAPSPRM